MPLRPIQSVENLVVPSSQQMVLTLSPADEWARGIINTMEILGMGHLWPEKPEGEGRVG
jgi:hypothetical protein